MGSDISETVKKWVQLTLYKSLNSIFKFSKENDISMPQIGALIRIYRKGSCNVSVIGIELGISSAAASQLLHRMVQLGLIDRSEDPNDRRIKNLNLTQKGLEFLNECFRTSYKWFEDLIFTYNNDEKREIITILDKLINKININDDIPDLEN
ncbi:MAG: MarR family winged helix-turn-helix transcriptional regulator [Promethearchaeota archaeon]